MNLQSTPAFLTPSPLWRPSVKPSSIPTSHVPIPSVNFFTLKSRRSFLPPHTLWTSAEHKSRKQPPYQLQTELDVDAPVGAQTPQDAQSDVVSNEQKFFNSNSSSEEPSLHDYTPTSKPEEAEISDNGSDDGNNDGRDGGDDKGGGNHDDGSNGSGDGEEHPEDSESFQSPIGESRDHTGDHATPPGSSARDKVSRVTSAASELGDSVTSSATSFVKTVPAPVTVALISTITTVVGSRIKSNRDQRVALKQGVEASRKRKSEIEKHLRQLYVELAEPMLKSAAKLGERLYALGDSDWKTVEAEDAATYHSSMYSAYLLGRYLATVEILKQESALLDYGFQTADRILSNILGRIQGVLNADDNVLIEMQETEHFFQPSPGEKALNGGLLRIPPRMQTVMGELLLRRLWYAKYDFVKVQKEKHLERGSKAHLTFLEFSRLLEQDAELQRWYNPVIADFEKLEQRIASNPKGRRRKKALGSRIYFLQSGLLDLVEFYDPLPYAKAIPYSRRRRLQIGPQRYNEEQRSPSSLYKLYNELANLRDHRVVEGDMRKRLRLSHGIEVFIAGAYGEFEPSFEYKEHGSCPFSQRVLITLHEMGISYKPVVILPEAKPAWFYLLNPQNKTPCMYHDGNVIEDSGHIVTYLKDRFPDAKPLASTKHLGHSRGTPAYTRFHPHFVRWMSGDEEAKKDLECELVKVNETIRKAQILNQGLPFLGGDSFSREDTALAPMLHNVEVAGREVKGWEFPQGCDALRKYVEEVRKMPSFISTVGKDAAIVEGYGGLERRGGERKHLLADILE